MSIPSSAQPIQGTASLSSEEAILANLIRTRMLRMRTSLPVRVESVTNDGGVSPIGRVSIRPLVQQVDGEGNATDHGIINNVPYFRIQGGANAVIMDPEVGDIGMALFADRDISAVKASGQSSPPGSSRTFNMTDAVYMGCVLAAAPTQYIQFSRDGITAHSPTRVRIEAPTAEVEAPTMTFTGSSTFNGPVDMTSGLSVGGILTNNGIGVGSTHRHSGVVSGPDISDPPT